jgi:hypothetical protein
MLTYLVFGVLALAAVGVVAVLVIGIGGTILGFATLPIVWCVGIVQEIITDWRRRKAARS